MLPDVKRVVIEYINQFLDSRPGPFTTSDGCVVYSTLTDLGFSEDEAMRIMYESGRFMPGDVVEDDIGLVPKKQEMEGIDDRLKRLSEDERRLAGGSEELINEFIDFYVDSKSPFIDKGAILKLYNQLREVGFLDYVVVDCINKSEKLNIKELPNTISELDLNKYMEDFDDNFREFYNITDVNYTEAVSAWHNYHVDGPEAQDYARVLHSLGAGNEEIVEAVCEGALIDRKGDAPSKTFQGCGHVLSYEDLILGMSHVGAGLIETVRILDANIDIEKNPDDGAHHDMYIMDLIHALYNFDIDYDSQVNILLKGAGIPIDTTKDVLNDMGIMPGFVLPRHPDYVSPSYHL